MGRNGNGFLQRLKPWQAVIAAVIAAVAAIVVALLGSSPPVSAVSSSDPRITIVQPNVGADTSSGSPTDLVGALTPSASIASPSLPLMAPKPTGRWIAQLASIPFSDGSAERDAQLEQIQEAIPQAQWLNSGDYGSLSPGFWVIYVDDHFSDGATAFQFCLQHGRSTEAQCVGRYLSSDPAEHSLQCFWSSTESAPDVCYEEPVK